MGHYSIHWFDAIAGAYALRTLAYAVATAPIPSNPWAQWLMGILHYLLLNLQEGRQNLAVATGATSYQAATAQREAGSNGSAGSK